MNKSNKSYDLLSQIYFALLIILSLLPSAFVEGNQLRQPAIIIFLVIVFLFFFFHMIRI
tara:strand:+ start:4522 stop:4698 length:177 start_codon:yes stop_codon:yes gene_type:complete